MTWLKITDRFYLEPVTTAMGFEVVGFHLVAMNFCADHLTNGYLTEDDIEYLRRLYGIPTAAPLIDKLVAFNQWEQVATMPDPLDPGHGYHIIHFLDDQPSREEVLERREKNKADVKAWRDQQRAKRKPKRRNRGVTTYLPVSTGTGTGNDSIQGDGVPAPQEGEGQQNPSPLTEHFGSSQERSRHDHRSDNDLIDAELADAAQQKARERRHLLARAKMRDLVSRSPLRVKGLPPQVTR